MTTLLAVFILALAFSLVLTPLAGRLGTRLGAVDMPAPRKVHTTPLPRAGGLAVFLSFVATIALTNLYETDITDLIVFDRRTAFGFYGALVVFGCGLWDDFRRLNPWVKLLLQILGATIAFAGGVSIGGFFLGGHGIHFGIFSYIITVFWFLLFINAVNLIDGLDGLASGVVFFASLLMVIMSVMRAEYLPAVYFAVIAGATLGFLRYNFNPASVFLGDGGSYFLGYLVAGLSITASVKSQVGALMLIPLLALGVPVFDTIVSPLRRWVRGRKVFLADNGHIHHRLLAMGISSKNTVLILYGVTVALCVLAILIVNLRNEMVGMILVILGVGALILLRKTGYLEYLFFDKLYGWFRDVTDEAGFSRERRTFLSLQMEMNKARTLEELCEQAAEVMEMLKLERMELHLKGKNMLDTPGCSPRGNGDPLPLADPERRHAGGGSLRPASSEIFNEIKKLENETVWICTRRYYRRSTDVKSEEMFKIDLPLDANGSRLLLMKDLARDPLEYYTLQRLEHLRRSLVSNLARLNK